jgi:hypothetical protein
MATPLSGGLSPVDAGAKETNADEMLRDGVERVLDDTRNGSSSSFALSVHIGFRIGSSPLINLTRKRGAA